MATTANYGFYSPPLTGVTPNVPRDMQTLANAVDTALKAEETARIAADATVSGSRNNTGTISIPNNAITVVALGTSELNEIPWTASTSNFFTVPTAGYYQINAGIYFNGVNTTGLRVLYLTVSGTTVAVAQQGGNAAGNGLNLSRGLKLASGATVQVSAFQTSGGALLLTGSASYNYLDVTRVSL